MTQENKNYWMHRIFNHYYDVAKPLLERGLLSIGFSDLSDKITQRESNAEASKKLREELEKQVETYPWLKTRRKTVINFIDMSKGDLILLPVPGSFWVVEIIDNQTLIPEEIEKETLDKIGLELQDKRLSIDDKKIDLGFFRRIKILHEPIARSYADNALQRRMKYRGTNICITDLKNSIEEAITKSTANENQYLSVQSKILNTDQILENIKEQISSNEMEKLVQYYFEKCGADEVSKPGSSGGGDCDCMAVFHSINFVIYAQIKKHEGKTSEDAVNQILKYMEGKNSNQDDEYASYTAQGWVISSSEKFDKAAEDLAEENNIKLIKGDEFAGMLSELLIK